jgi:predicted RNA-binding protein YlxR (DUF448 family)
MSMKQGNSSKNLIIKSYIFRITMVHEKNSNLHSVQNLLHRSLYTTDVKECSQIDMQRSTMSRQASKKGWRNAKLERTNLIEILLSAKESFEKYLDGRRL